MTDTKIKMLIRALALLTALAICLMIPVYAADEIADVTYGFKAGVTDETTGDKGGDDEGGAGEDDTGEGGADEGDTGEGGAGEDDTDEGGADEGDTDEGGANEGNIGENGSGEGGSGEENPPAAGEIHTGVCGRRVTWTLDTGDGSLVIAGTGAMAGYSAAKPAPWSAYRDTITSVIIADGVTSVGSRAFYRCDGLTVVTMPDGLQSIGDYAFAYCDRLTAAALPEGLVSIGVGAFEGCDSLTDVTIPARVEAIGGAAFARCGGLTAIHVADGSEAFISVDGVLLNREGSELLACPGGLTGAYTVPDGVRRVADWAFAGCAGLTAVTLPDGLEAVGDGAFSLCTGLETIVFPDSVTDIGGEAFSYCVSLTAAPLPDGLLTLGGWAFAWCTALEEATIPASVSVIGDGAFAGCESLAAVTIGEGVSSVGDYAFSGCASLAAVSLPDGVETVGERAFSWCTSLASVVLPDTVTVIGEGAFENCTALAALRLPDRLAIISPWTFEYCTGLASVIVPESVTTVGSYAFAGCTALADVYYSGTEAAWDELVIGSYNTPLTNAAIHFGFDADTPVFRWADDLVSALVTYVDADGRLVTVDAAMTVSLDSFERSGVVIAASYADDDGRAINKITYTAAVTAAGVTYTDTAEKYGLFAGWYRDAACTTPFTDRPGADDVKYAKLTDPAVLTVKYQLRNPTYATDSSTRLRVVTTVDSLDYASVGFILSYVRPTTGIPVTRTVSTQKVYVRLAGVDSIGSFDYAPTVFSDASAYFCAYAMDLPSALYYTALRFQPMWTTADGTVVYGTARSITASESSSFIGFTWR